MRLDQALCARGFAPSRHRAQLLIDDRAVTINGVLARKASQAVLETDRIEVANTIPYVSRAGLKLAHALEVFHIDPNELDCLDIGSSTGGFTDVLIQQGAAHVDAVDVGTNQLHESLRTHERVDFFEQTDIRDFHPGKTYDLIVMDASFISQLLIIPKIKELARTGTIVITLIKPQFEVGRDGIGKGGMVLSDELAQESVRRIIQAYTDAGFEQVASTTDSPILGGDGNREYIAVFRKP